MRKLVVTTFVSLDGVMQAPGRPDEDRDGGFAHGGWQVPHFDEHMGGVLAERLPQIGALLLGRRTYEIFAASWPRVADTNPIAATLNRVPKYVVSRTRPAMEWHNSTLLTGEVAAAVADLKGGPGGEIHVQGSGELIQTLMRHDLVDEYVLWTFPVLLGSGKRLFGPGTIPTGLELVRAETATTGVAMHTYRSIGRPAYGAFVHQGSQIVQQPG